MHPFFEVPARKLHIAMDLFNQEQKYWMLWPSAVHGRLALTWSLVRRARLHETEPVILALFRANLVKS